MTASSTGPARPGAPLVAGAAGAVALTTAHQLGRWAFADAPRMDVLGMRAMAQLRRAAGIEVPDHDTLYWQTMAGDLLSNAAYYSLVGVGSREGRWARGTALGVAAGIGALVLPRRIGLGDPPASGSVRNQWLTIAWYVIGGLTTAAVLQALDRPND